MDSPALNEEKRMSDSVPGSGANVQSRGYIPASFPNYKRERTTLFVGAPADDDVKLITREVHAYFKARGSRNPVLETANAVRVGSRTVNRWLEEAEKLARIRFHEEDSSDHKEVDHNA